MSEQITDKLYGRLIPGSYASVDVSQTKDKGVAICLLTFSTQERISITYFHQPFLSSNTTRDEVERMVNLWPQELRSAQCYSVDSPLCYARRNGGRLIDRWETWKKLGFGAYLNHHPQQAPTKSKAQEKGKHWIAIGMWFAEVLRAFSRQVFEVYPTPSLNALHLWQMGNIPLKTWFREEPGEYTVISEGGSMEELSLRYLERLKGCAVYGGMRTRFRKLMNWPYPDLWDAFGGAVTSLLYNSKLTENVEKAPIEGRIVVPMRLETLQSRGILEAS